MTTCAAKELGLKPFQLFSENDYVGDPTVEKAIKERTKEHFVMAERVGKERNIARERIVKLENTNAENEKKLNQHTVQSKGSSVFEAILADPERKINDKAKIFINRQYKTFSSTAENEDALKTDMGKFVDDSMKEYGEIAKDVFGIETEKTEDPNKFKLPANLTVAGQKTEVNESSLQSKYPKERSEVLAEEMDPTKNYLIPGGEAAKEALKT